MVTIIIPVYNEVNIIRQSLIRLSEFKPFDGYEKIIVDDGSTDGTAELLRFMQDRVDKIITHRHNLGKGAAIKTGLRHAKNTEKGVFAILDADLEYSLSDLERVIEPVKNGSVPVCFGNRFHSILVSPSNMTFLHCWANRLLSWLTSLISGTRIQDVETCLKAFDRSLFDKITLRSNGFSVETELAIKAIRITGSILEIPISYTGRCKAQGKKIRFKDGLEALFSIFRYGFAS